MNLACEYRSTSGTLPELKPSGQLRMVEQAHVPFDPGLDELASN